MGLESHLRATVLQTAEPTTCSTHPKSQPDRPTTTTASDSPLPQLLIGKTLSGLPYLLHHLWYLGMELTHYHNIIFFDLCLASIPFIKDEPYCSCNICLTYSFFQESRTGRQGSSNTSIIFFQSFFTIVS